MSRALRPAFVLAICVVLVTACDEKLLGPGNCPGSLTYSYTGFTEADSTAFVSGTLHLKFDNPGGSEPHAIAVEGWWVLEPVGKPDIAWPTYRSGRLAGEVKEDGELFLDLFPDWADHNVLLLGRFHGSRCEGLTGEWSFVTFSGPTSRGTFRAEGQ